MSNMCDSGEEHKLLLNCSDILVVGSGASCVPPMGFQPMPSTSFKDGSPYPTAKYMHK